jgi:hypothetical protein
VGEHLLPWAKRTMSAHLIKLEKEGMARLDKLHWQVL